MCGYWGGATRVSGDAARGRVVAVAGCDGAGCGGMRRHGRSSLPTPVRPGSGSTVSGNTCPISAPVSGAPVWTVPCIAHTNLSYVTLAANPGAPGRFQDSGHLFRIQNEDQRSGTKGGY